MVEMTSKERNKFVASMRNLSGTMSQANIKWFLCFGSLLSLVRDRKVDMTQDIDIGVVGTSPLLVDTLSRAFQPMHCVRHDVTGEVLNQSYRCVGTNIIPYTLDVFFWLKVGNMYYHTYDVNQSRPKDGILKGYTFKGVPASYFEAPDEVVEKYRRDSRLGRALNKNGTWVRLIPGYESTGISLAAPYLQGSCLDKWYPDWPMRRPEWGVSETPWVKKVKSCRELV